MHIDLAASGDIRRFRRQPPAHTTAVPRILATLHDATPAQEAEGREWYAYAHRMATSLGDGNAQTGAGILAALSPGCSWERSVTLAWDMVEQGDCAHPYGPCITNARAVIDGADFDSLYRFGCKVRSFYRNILHPLDSRYVTVDRHAFAILFGHTVGTNLRAILDRPNGYLHCAESYRRAATIAQLPAPTLQAITWIVWRDIYQYDDPTEEVF